MVPSLPVNGSLSVSALCLLLCGCGASSLERFFPLVDGTVYTYTFTFHGEVSHPVEARVHRSDARHGELRFRSGPVTAFTFAPDGVLLDARSGSTYVLKLPLATGTSWSSESGRPIRIVDTAASIDTPAGHFKGCVQTVEWVLGDKDMPSTHTTTFCPEVGLVQVDMVEVATGTSDVRQTLTSYAPPVRIRR